MTLFECIGIMTKSVEDSTIKILLMSFYVLPVGAIIKYFTTGNEGRKLKPQKVAFSYKFPRRKIIFCIW